MGARVTNSETTEGKRSNGSIIALGILAVVIGGGIATAAVLFSQSEGDQATSRCVDELRSMVEADPGIAMGSWTTTEPLSDLEAAEQAMAMLDNATPERIAEAQATLEELRQSGYTWHVGGTFNGTYTQGGVAAGDALFNWTCQVDYHDGAFQAPSVTYTDPTAH